MSINASRVIHFASKRVIAGLFQKKGASGAGHAFGTKREKEERPKTEDDAIKAEALRERLLKIVSENGFVYPGDKIECALAGGLDKNFVVAQWREYAAVLDPNAWCEQTRTTPLLMATRWNNPALINLLLDWGTNPRVTPQARSVLQEAAGHTHLDVTKLLLQRCTWTEKEINAALLAATETYCDHANEVMDVLISHMRSNVRDGTLEREACRETLTNGVLRAISSWAQSQHNPEKMARLSPRRTLFRVLALAAAGADSARVVGALDLLDRPIRGQVRSVDQLVVGEWINVLTEQEGVILRKCLSTKDEVADRVNAAVQRLALSDRPNTEAVPNHVVDMDEVEASVMNAVQTIRTTLGQLVQSPEATGTLETLQSRDIDYEKLARAVQQRLLQALDFTTLPNVLAGLDTVCERMVLNQGDPAASDIRSLFCTWGADQTPAWGDAKSADDTAKLGAVEDFGEQFAVVQRHALLGAYSQSGRVDLAVARIIDEALIRCPEPATADSFDPALMVE